MKIIIFTVDHIYANKIVRDLLSEYGSDIILVVESEALLPKKTKLQALMKYLKISGLYYVFVQIVKLEIYKFLSILTRTFSLKNSKFYSYKQIAAKYKTNLILVKDVNEKLFINKISNTAPDLIISVFFNQIFSSEIIDLPKKGTINIHPAYLPDYKGVSPVFWSLANSEKYIGATVHYINKGIDTGEIIEREKVKILKEDTEDSLYWKICGIASPLLIKAIGKIDSGKVKVIKNTGGRYFSLPSLEAVDRYRKKYSFFNPIDFIFG